jgi:hypothetical protein
MAEAEEKNKVQKLTPVPRRSGLENVRKQVQAEHAEAATLEGIVRIEAITGLDVVPNEISSKPPEPITIRPTECYVDRDYQRTLSRKSIKLIHSMVEGWDWMKFKAPIVTKDDQGRYLIIDGQHTAIGAATHPDLDKIPAMFIPLQDVAEQAKSFIGHNTARIPVAPLDLYHARITGGDETVVTANRILNENGITVVRSVQGRGHAWQTNQTVATGAILKVLDKHGLPKFVQVVEFIAKCNFSPIRADQWKFAEALITGGDKTFTPSMMLKVVESTNDNDALNEAQKIANSMGISNWQGLTLFYKNSYIKAYRIR